MHKKINGSTLPNEDQIASLLHKSRNVLIRRRSVRAYPVKADTATCRVRPRRNKGRHRSAPQPARDAEQRAEGVETVEPSVEAERELIEVGL